ncbi:MAG: MlaD family protein [Candidatus Aminicenantia bacterium]
MVKKRLKAELKIGIFVILALSVLAIFIIKMGNVALIFEKPGYPLLARFDSIAGLEKNAAVRVAGVKVGVVKGIGLIEGKAEVLMIIDPQVKIRRDSKASVSSLGLMGEKYIEIFPGQEPVFVKPGDTIQGIQPLSLDQMGSMFLSIGQEIKSISQHIQDILGPEETKGQLKNILQNLDRVSNDLREFSQQNKDKLGKTIDRSHQVLGKFDTSLKEVSDNINELTSTLREIAQENKDGIRENFKKIEKLTTRAEESLRLLNETLKKINEGEGTLGQLINDPEIYQKIDKTIDQATAQLNVLSETKLNAGFTGYYLTNNQLVQSSIDLYVFSKKNRFLLGQLVKDPRENTFKFSAQGGMKFGALWARGGLIESELGLGLDYFLFKDKLKFSLESFDFNRSSQPRFRFLTKFSLSDNLFLIAGVDDFTLVKKREYLFGLGIGMK